MERFLYSLLFTSLFLFSLPGQDFLANLQLDLDFQNGSLLDASDNATPGIGYDLSSAVGVEGTVNSAFQFNGMSSYIDLGTANREIVDQLTVSAWIRTTAIDADRQVIIAKYDVNDDAGFLLSVKDGKGLLSGRNGSGNFYELTSNAILVNDGKWHHIVGVINQNSWELYIDCQLVDELTTTAVLPDYSIPDPLTIGRLPVPTNLGEWHYFQGAIDNVKLYNVPLTSSEISEISDFTCQTVGVPPFQSIVKRIFSNDQLEAYSTLELPDDELLILGSTQQNGEQANALVIRCTQAGEIIWAKSLATSGMETPIKVIQTSDGGFAIVGLTTSGSLGDADVLVVKLQDDGSVTWSKVYGGAAEDRGLGIMEVAGNNLLISGSTRSFGAGQRDALLMKLEADGDVIWTRTYGGSNGNDIFIDGWKVSDTEFIFNGVTLSYGQGAHDIWLLKVDDDGNFLSGNTYGNDNDENPISIKRLNDGSYIIAGHSTSFDLGGYDVLLMKLNAAGEIQWAKIFGSDGDDQVRGVLIDKDENIILEGNTNSAGAGLTDLFLLEVDSEGTFLNARTYGLGGEDGLHYIGLEPLLELPNNRLFKIGTIGQESTTEILFANLFRQEDDVCIGADWSPAIANAEVIRETLTPTLGEPDIETANLAIIAADYPLSTDYFTSDFCPSDLEITDNTTLCSYQAANDLWTTGPVEIQGTITYKAGNSITLRPGFRVESGNQFRALIEDCSATELTTANRDEFNDLEAISSNQISHSTPLKVYPNPTTASFTLEMKLAEETLVNLSLWDADGRPVMDLMNRTLLNEGTYSQEFSIGQLPPGMYIVRYQTIEETQSIRLMVLGRR